MSWSHNLNGWRSRWASEQAIGTYLEILPVGAVSEPYAVVVEIQEGNTRSWGYMKPTSHYIRRASVRQKETPAVALQKRGESWWLLQEQAVGGGSAGSNTAMA